MALSGVKDNKCFSPIIKYSATKTVTVAAGAEMHVAALVSDDSISETDTLIVTLQATGTGGSTYTPGSITEFHEIWEGGYTVYFSSTGGSAQTVTFNVTVI